MKILFLVRSLENGGAERQLAILASELGRRGHSVAIAVLYKRGEYQREIDSSLVRIIDLKKKSRWDIVPFTSRLLRMVREESPDIVHGYLSAGNVAAAIGCLGCPGAKLVWGVRDGGMEAKSYGWMTRLTGQLLRRLARRADLIIFNSQSGSRWWCENGYATIQNACVPNGVDVSYFQPDPVAGSVTRQRWGVPSGVSLVGMIARVDPAKDYSTFLRAASSIAGNYPNTRFICLGSGPAAEKNRLISLAGRLGLEERILWPESTRDMRGVYNALDVVCLASKSEGFPNVVAEAMACGRPVVASDTGDASLITGNLGRIVPVGDVRALADALAAALSNRSADPETMRARITNYFGVETLAVRTEEALDLLGRQNFS